MSLCTARLIASIELVSTYLPSGEQQDEAQLGWFSTLDIMTYIKDMLDELPFD
ncbi:hypothetical protein LZP73_14255 [Shewanella sp. AS16]|uniref:hypothetical protein n=1 Tax=Shewanella sp. AS16 TaxID=2907625 RepID=UPI001F269F04|nr:hypothetical protein [Shewanella sp. AS16]MCE9687352.1 hypothetical protein [Shewanella sp. AS16]